MKWKKSNQTANEGVLYVEDIVNQHGSIFRPVHEEVDVGIDGYIELVENENATGKIIAVQIKSGESYLTENGKHFRIPTDKEHLEYWASYLVPVIVIGYSPKLKRAAWEVVSEYIQREEYYDRTTIKSIKIDINDAFDVNSISKSLVKVANASKDRSILIDCVDNCLAGSEREKIAALSVLRAHPDSRDSKTTAFVARRLIFEESNLVAKEAIHVLGYHVGRNRWSWNPTNRKEMAVIDYAYDLCKDLTYEECLRLIELVDDEPFYGRDALGERVLDIISCVYEIALFLSNIAANGKLEMQTRINALYVLYNCDENELLADISLKETSEVADVYEKIKSIVESWD
ncbi:DUF4365 domain-containing protein [Vibrio parahaemolyticus]|uniref:DUF4365 domain-containing protein n=1 Tax=Vibrio parahaemolyticus TaxID=670 RepID=UPI00226B25E0|nr:DUF4365 domain-containing protein [Vibrio parahaemolyticus]MCX8793822.1 DUF4365 domain-containing protein [Vibrio parahaemolyticus]